MPKYFNNNYQTPDELKKEYSKLVREYHPNFAKDKDEFERLNTICSEIISEYKLLLKTFPKNKSTNENTRPKLLYDYIINGNEEALSACSKIVYHIFNLNIDYNFYDTTPGVQWKEEKLLSERNDTIELFWDICLEKNIIGDEFAKLFELCDCNAEKMKRTIMFLSTGAISENDIHINLTSTSPIPFFDDNITVENLPDYNSFLLLSKEITKKGTKKAWIEFCQKQRDSFYKNYYDLIIPKIPSGKQK